MKYKFYFDKNTNSNKAEFYDEGYEEFGGWFCYESAAGIIHDKVLNYIQSSDNTSQTICGSEYVNYISIEGLSIRPMEAFELDLDRDEYLESKKIPLEEICKLIQEWRKLESIGKECRGHI